MNGYFQVRQELFHEDGFQLLSIGARGALFELLGLADLSRFEAKIFGAICGQSDLCTAQDVILTLATREMAAAKPDAAGDDDALEMAGWWLYELRDAGFVEFGNEFCPLVVSLYVRLCGCTQRTRYVPGERRGGNLAVAVAGQGVGIGGQSAGVWGRSVAACATVAPARLSPCPSSPPPMVRCAHGLPEEMDALRGGKGAVSSMVADSWSNQTRPNPNFQTPSNQTRADAMAGGGDEGQGEGEFHDKIWNSNILSAAQFACQQSDPLFVKAFLARCNHYGQDVCRHAIEYVATQMRDQPHTIKFTDRCGRRVGGPILWRKLEEFGEARGIKPYEKKRAVGFQ